MVASTWLDGHQGRQSAPMIHRFTAIDIRRVQPRDEDDNNDDDDNNNENNNNYHYNNYYYYLLLLLFAPQAFRSTPIEFNFL